MMSDPQTAPRDPLERIIFGIATAFVAAGLISFQSTEFGVKLGILSSLTVTCALVPLIETAMRRIRRQDPNIPLEPSHPRPVLSRIRGAALKPPVIAAIIIAVRAPVDTAALANDEQLILIERGLSGQRNAQ